MTTLIPNIEYIKNGNIEATDIVIKVIFVGSFFMIGSSLFFTFFG